MSWLGIFQSSRPGPPPGADTKLWEQVLLHTDADCGGDPEAHPWVAPRIAAVLAMLREIHHQDERLIAARRNHARAVRELGLEAEEERRVIDDTARLVTEAELARARRGDVVSSHRRSEGARAQGERRAAVERRAGAFRRANLAEADLGTATGEVIDRMMVEATRQVPDLQAFVALLNHRRTYLGRDPLPTLPDDLAERLVLRATHRPGEPDPQPGDPDRDPAPDLPDA